jgi:hypothetical protein
VHEAPSAKQAQQLLVRKSRALRLLLLLLLLLVVAVLRQACCTLSVSGEKLRYAARCLGWCKATAGPAADVQQWVLVCTINLIALDTSITARGNMPDIHRCCCLLLHPLGSGVESRDPRPAANGICEAASVTQ